MPLDPTNALQCPTCGKLWPHRTVSCLCGYNFDAARLGLAQSGVPWLYKTCLILILLWTIVCFIGACYGMVNIATMPNMTDPYVKTGRDVGTMIGLGVWAMMWVIPTMGLGIIGLLVKPR
jgi:hypothetical protein